MGVVSLIKLGANIALGIGNQAIIGGIVKQVVADNQSKMIQVCAKFASTALAGAATAVCSENVNQTIDQVVALVDKLKEGSKKQEAEPQEA